MPSSDPTPKFPGIFLKKILAIKSGVLCMQWRCSTTFPFSRVLQWPYKKAQLETKWLRMSRLPPEYSKLGSGCLDSGCMLLWESAPRPLQRKSSDYFFLSPDISAFGAAWDYHPDALICTVLAQAARSCSEADPNGLSDHSHSVPAFICNCNLKSTIWLTWMVDLFPSHIMSVNWVRIKENDWPNATLVISPNRDFSLGLNPLYHTDSYIRPGIVDFVYVAGNV